MTEEANVLFLLVLLIINALSFTFRTFTFALRPYQDIEKFSHFTYFSLGHRPCFTQ